MEKIINKIAQELNVKPTQVENAVKLIDEGNTIPFIARYRKEATGGLSDEILRDLGERLNYLRNLENRKEEVKNSIEEQGKLTDEIVNALQNAKILAEVEDIYRPYKQKKRTRATVAKEKGLAPLSEALINQDNKVSIEEIAKKKNIQVKKITFWWDNKKEHLKQIEIRGILLKGSDSTLHTTDNPSHVESLKKILMQLYDLEESDVFVEVE